MNISEARELPPAELQSEILKAREKLWKMRFQARGEPVENPGALRGLKKDIARLLTVLSEKKLAARAERRRRGRKPGGTPSPASGGGEASGVAGDASRTGEDKR